MSDIKKFERPDGIILYTDQDDKYRMTAVIPDGMTAVRPFAFKGNDKLIKVYIPNSVTSIGEQAFLGCKSLESISIPKNIAVH